MAELHQGQSELAQHSHRLHHALGDGHGSKDLSGLSLYNGGMAFTMVLVIKEVSIPLLFFILSSIDIIHTLSASIHTLNPFITIFPLFELDDQLSR